MTYEEFITRATTIHGDRYTYPSQPISTTREYVTIECAKHGAFRQQVDKHLYGSGCPKCAKNARVDFDEFVRRAKAVHGDKYTYHRDTYHSVSKKTTITCPEHGDFYQNPSKHYGGQGCAACYTRRTERNFVQTAAAVHGGKYRYIEAYKGYYTPIAIYCPEHGAFCQTPSNHLFGNGCPKCSCADNRSALERKLHAVFPTAIASDRSTLVRREIDLLITPSVGVEVNGRYWHSESKGKDSQYHLKKTEQAAARGVQLLHFWEDEVRGKFDLVCAVIRAKQGLFARRIYARHTVVREVPREICVTFLSDNHLQGNTAATIRLGLFYGDELVSVMTFGKPRFNKTYHWELLRYATLQDTQVIGGASKLLAAFCATHEGSIISYANRRWADGAMYARLGFAFVGATKPSYEWFGNGRVLSRYQCQKRKLPNLLGDGFSADLAEAQNMQRNGYMRTWDCGNFVFALHR